MSKHPCRLGGYDFNWPVAPLPSRMLVIMPRPRPRETQEAWLKRCRVVKNIGEKHDHPARVPGDAERRRGRDDVKMPRNLRACLRYLRWMGFAVVSREMLDTLVQRKRKAK